MLRSAFYRADTQITGFYGRADRWGSTLQTITGRYGRFSCITTIGHRIAAACDDGAVEIYDSVTGVLRPSLSPPHPVCTMKGSPDGSILFCTHRKSPSITLWDIQTGGLIHTFTAELGALDIAVSSGGRCLACGTVTAL
jgi:WD40 repeat protein